MAQQFSSVGFTYEVFLSFRGIDTRRNFTGNLYKALRDKGIHTFMDDSELQGGEEITPSLLKAIENSRIAIIVLSENYASSSFCLDELVKIIDVFNVNDRLVLPVFYGVEPTHLRHHTGSYGIALAQHEKKLQSNIEKLQKWKTALNQVANLSGHTFDPTSTGKEYEYEFIGKIVDMVSNKISRTPLHVADFRVGLESRLLKVKSLLNMRSNEGVSMVGIHGIGGIGKTTLAREIYNSIVNQFEGSCFLDDLREKTHQYGLVHLQETLLHETIRDKDIKFGSESKGISIIKQRLHTKKVLLILDDVDDLKQLEALVGGCDWYGPGSEVIITTRDQHLLKSHGIEKTYEVEELNKDEALELLMWKAFKNNNVDSSYDDVLNGVVTYASGLPLALEVVGSNLCGKHIEEWDSTLARFKRGPHQKIQKILQGPDDKIEIIKLASYDTPVDWNGILKAFKKMRNLKTLTINSSHDESSSESNFSKGPKHFPTGLSVLEWKWYPFDEFIPLSKKFENMTVLKFHKSWNLKETPDVSGVPNLEIFSFRFCENLITVHKSVGFLSKLKILDVEGCLLLKSFPPIIKLPSLQELRLSDTNLESFPEISGEMKNIRELTLDLTPIEKFPSSFQNLTKLRILTIRSKLEWLREDEPDIEHPLLPISILMMPSLYWVDLFGYRLLALENDNPGAIVPSNIKILHLEECELSDEILLVVLKLVPNVKELNLSKCRSFTIIPECIKECHFLKRLILNDCSSIKEMRGIPPNLKYLEDRNGSLLTDLQLESMLLNQKLHEDGGTEFCFTGRVETIPEWFEHQSKGTSISFWFRKRVPAVAFFLHVEREHQSSGFSTNFGTCMRINGNIDRLRLMKGNPIWMSENHHIYVGDVKLQEQDIILGLRSKLDDALLRNEWIHAKVEFYKDWNLSEEIFIESGIHVFKQKTNMSDIRFTNPYEGKRKLDDYLNTSLPRVLEEGCVKVSCVVVFCSESEATACGGILQDDLGSFLGGFYGHIGQVQILYSELNAILDGIQFAWNKGYRKIIVESRSRSAIQMLKEEIPTPDLSCLNLVREIQIFANSADQVVWSYTSSNENREAYLYAIAGLKLSWKDGIVSF